MRPDRLWDFSWNAVSEAAVHLGDDFWSLEYRLPFGVQPSVRPLCRGWTMNHWNKSQPPNDCSGPSLKVRVH